MLDNNLLDQFDQYVRDLRESQPRSLAIYANDKTPVLQRAQRAAPLYRTDGANGSRSLYSNRDWGIDPQGAL